MDRRHKKAMKVNILKMVIDVWNDVGVSAEMELVRYTLERAILKHLVWFEPQKAREESAMH